MKRGNWETSSPCYFNASCSPEAIFIVERFEGETIFSFCSTIQFPVEWKISQTCSFYFHIRKRFLRFIFPFLWPMPIPESEPLLQYDTLTIRWLDQIIQASLILIPEIIVVNSLPFICLFFLLLNMKVSDIYILYFSNTSIFRCLLDTLMH